MLSIQVVPAFIVVSIVLSYKVYTQSQGGAEKKKRKKNDYSHSKAVNILSAPMVHSPGLSITLLPHLVTVSTEEKKKNYVCSHIRISTRIHTHIYLITMCLFLTPYLYQSM